MPPHSEPGQRDDGSETGSTFDAGNGVGGGPWQLISPPETEEAGLVAPAETETAAAAGAVLMPVQAAEMSQAPVPVAAAASEKAAETTEEAVALAPEPLATSPSIPPPPRPPLPSPKEGPGGPSRHTQAARPNEWRASSPTHRRTASEERVETMKGLLLLCLVALVAYFYRAELYDMFATIAEHSTPEQHARAVCAACCATNATAPPPGPRYCPINLLRSLRINARWPREFSEPPFYSGRKPMSEVSDKLFYHCRCPAAAVAAPLATAGMQNVIFGGGRDPSLASSSYDASDGHSPIALSATVDPSPADVSEGHPRNVSAAATVPGGRGGGWLPKPLASPRPSHFRGRLWCPTVSWLHRGTPSPAQQSTPSVKGRPPPRDFDPPRLATSSLPNSSISSNTSNCPLMGGTSQPPSLLLSVAPAAPFAPVSPTAIPLALTHHEGVRPPYQRVPALTPHRTSAPPVWILAPAPPLSAAAPTPRSVPPVRTMLALSAAAPAPGAAILAMSLGLPTSHQHFLLRLAGRFSSSERRSAGRSMPEAGGLLLIWAPTDRPSSHPPAHQLQQPLSQGRPAPIPLSKQLDLHSPLQQPAALLALSSSRSSALALPAGPLGTTPGRPEEGAYLAVTSATAVTISAAALAASVMAGATGSALVHWMSSGLAAAGEAVASASHSILSTSLAEAGFRAVDRAAAAAVASLPQCQRNSSSLSIGECINVVTAAASSSVKAVSRAATAAAAASVEAAAAAATHPDVSTAWGSVRDTATHAAMRAAGTAIITAGSVRDTATDAADTVVRAVGPLTRRTISAVKAATLPWWENLSNIVHTSPFGVGGSVLGTAKPHPTTKPLPTIKPDNVSASLCAGAPLINDAAPTVWNASASALSLARSALSPLPGRAASWGNASASYWEIRTEVELIRTRWELFLAGYEARHAARAGTSWLSLLSRPASSQGVTTTTASSWVNGSLNVSFTDKAQNAEPSEAALAATLPSTLPSPSLSKDSHPPPPTCPTSNTTVLEALTRRYPWLSASNTPVGSSPTPCHSSSFMEALARRYPWLSTAPQPLLHDDESRIPEPSPVPVWPATAAERQQQLHDHESRADEPAAASTGPSSVAKQQYRQQYRQPRFAFGTAASATAPPAAGGRGSKKGKPPKPSRRSPYRPPRYKYRSDRSKLRRHAA